MANQDNTTTETGTLTETGTRTFVLAETFTGGDSENFNDLNGVFSITDIGRCIENVRRIDSTSPPYAAGYYMDVDEQFTFMTIDNIENDDTVNETGYESYPS